MGVQASMSISLIVDNKLWRLISYHNYGSGSGIHISLPIREIYRGLSDIASSNIPKPLFSSRIDARRPLAHAPPKSSPLAYIASSAADLLNMFGADFGSVGKDLTDLNYAPGFLLISGMMPRSSFKRWSETVVSTSRVWTEDEVDASATSPSSPSSTTNRYPFPISATQESHPKFNVLVAEDNSLNNRLLETRLKRRGYTVQLAVDG
ncbi:hypothetical protein BDZ45DRAFT_712549 [Acephala macrosclerotiorum]|nr:hypothetical protein BDZ45DRAFT_712549 [Acephala macrosclerotiorum]